MNLKIRIYKEILNNILMYMLREKKSNPLQSNHDIDL